MKFPWISPYCVVLCAFALTLSGCSTAPTSPGFVAKSWSDNFKELRIIPVFPPREDVQVGDIYAIAVDEPDKETAFVDAFGNPILGVWVDSLDLKSSLDTFYTGRPEFPQTPNAATSGANANGVGGPFEEASGTKIFSGGTTNRLRSVGFPGFLAARVTGVEIGALVPAEILETKAGLSVRNARAATVSVPYAESYGLPAAKVITHWQGNKPRLFTEKAVSEDWFLYFGKVPKYVDVTIVTEVFYARTFDVALESSSDSGFTLSTPLTGEKDKDYQKALEDAKAKKEASDEAAGASTSEKPAKSAATESFSSTGTKSGDLTTALEGRLSAIEASLSRAKGMVTKYPGFAVQVFDSNRGDVALRRTFTRPIAIGYRGLRLRYEVGTAERGSMLVNGGTTMTSLSVNGTVLQQKSSGESK